jgi:hypothetical protein
VRTASLEDAPEADVIPDRTTRDAAWIDLAAFKELAWEDEPKELNWGRVMHNAVLFGNLIDQ